jgi:hypothetical protein
MAADFRVVKLPTVQGDFTRRYGSASDGEGCEASEEGGGKLHGETDRVVHLNTDHSVLWQKKSDHY